MTDSLIERSSFRLFAVDVVGVDATQVAAGFVASADLSKRSIVPETVQNSAPLGRRQSAATVRGPVVGVRGHERP
ncbi:hypothetical protein [Streptomyces sp. NPDC093261]|uniref:hypothetical protein n=1 Tax=Streptomyces sp. NPDC093261 TaxID=3366037 RepID=UPI003811E9A9